MNKVKELTVFFPAFNEEKNIQKTVLDAKNVLQNVVDNWEILVINDGSKDNTARVVENIANKDKRIKLISHPKNLGYGGAIKTGLANSRYDLVAQVDSDGQFDFSEINLFLKKINQADLVIGYRKRRTDSFYRRILQRTLWLADWILFGLNVKDVDCGFKLIKREVINAVGVLTTESAITVTEFIVRAKKIGYKICQVGVAHHARLKGEQTGGKLKIISKAAFEGLKLWLILLNEPKRN